MILLSVTQRLFVGSKLDATFVQKARSEGITHVLNVAQELFDDRMEPQYPAQYQKIGVFDTALPPNNEWFAKVLSTSLEILADPASHLLIHCHAARHRSISAAYLVLRGFGMKPMDARRLLPAGIDPKYGPAADQYLLTVNPKSSASHLRHYSYNPVPLTPLTPPHSLTTQP